MGNNFGSFGALSPEEMSAVKSALERRGMGDKVPALNQQSMSSATPAPLPPEPQGGVAPAPQIGELGGGGQMVSQGTPVGSPEAELIIKALSDRLKSDSKVKEAQSGLMK